MEEPPAGSAFSGQEQGCPRDHDRLAAPGTGAASRLETFERTRILVIDRNLLTAEALVLASERAGYRARFLTPVAPARLRAEVETFQPALALLDADCVGLDSRVELVTILQEAGVLTVAMGDKLDVLADCVTVGVAYAIEKNLPFSVLANVMSRLLTRSETIGGYRRQLMSGPLEEELRARRARLAPFRILTYREKCVLAMLIEGRSADAIAATDGVSISTVRSQIKAILQKLGVNSQLAATALARQAGWSFNVDSRTWSR